MTSPIRPASFADIPRLAAMLEAAHAASVYAHLTFDAAETKKLFLHAIQRHGRRLEGGAYVQVAEGADGRVEAFILGVLQRVYLVHAELEATDLFFVATEAAPPRAARALLEGMKAWAWSAPGVVQVQCAATGAMGRGYELTGRWLRASGMVPHGAIYREERPAAQT